MIGKTLNHFKVLDTDHMALAPAQGSVTGVELFEGIHKR
jgi:hypothetical protein